MWEIILLIVCLFLVALPMVSQSTQATTEDTSGPGIKLHRPDGSAFYVNAHTIGLVREPLDSENGNSVIVFATGGTQACRETVQEILDLLSAEGAH